MNLRMILEMMAMTILGGAGIVFPVGLSLLFFFNGEFDGSQTLTIYAILAWLMIPEKQGAV